MRRHVIPNLRRRVDVRAPAPDDDAEEAEWDEAKDEVEAVLDEKDVVVILTEWRAPMDNFDHWVVWLQDLCRSWAIEIIIF